MRLHLSPIVGYLLAGVAVGPFTPGFVADLGLAEQLAEIGVILLMFGVGLHFSLNDLLAVRRIAVPGAIVQIVAATLLGGAVAYLWGWPPGAALVLGLALSVASTVVLLRAMEERDALASPEGHIAVGWLVVEDLVMVIVLVLLPALAVPLGGIAHDVGLDSHDIGLKMTDINPAMPRSSGPGPDLGKSRLRAGDAAANGRCPGCWIRWRGRLAGLFTLATLAAALAWRWRRRAVRRSFALGAFFAGIVINASGHSHRAQLEARPAGGLRGALRLGRHAVRSGDPDPIPVHVAEGWPSSSSATSSPS